MKLKKLAIVSSLAFIALAMAGCNKDNSKSTTTKPTVVTKDNVTTKDSNYFSYEEVNFTSEDDSPDKIYKRAFDAYDRVAKECKANANELSCKFVDILVNTVKNRTYKIYDYDNLDNMKKDINEIYKLYAINAINFTSEIRLAESVTQYKYIMVERYKTIESHMYYFLFFTQNEHISELRTTLNHVLGSVNEKQEVDEIVDEYLDKLIPYATLEARPGGDLFEQAEKYYNELDEIDRKVGKIIDEYHPTMTYWSNYNNFRDELKDLQKEVCEVNDYYEMDPVKNKVKDFIFHVYEDFEEVVDPSIYDLRAYYGKKLDTYEEEYIKKISNETIKNAIKEIITSKKAEVNELTTKTSFKADFKTIYNATIEAVDKAVLDNLSVLTNEINNKRDELIAKIDYDEIKNALTIDIKKVTDDILAITTINDYFENIDGMEKHADEIINSYADSYKDYLLQKITLDYNFCVEKIEEYTYYDDVEDLFLQFVELYSGKIGEIKTLDDAIAFRDNDKSNMDTYYNDILSLILEKEIVKAKADVVEGKNDTINRIKEIDSGEYGDNYCDEVNKRYDEFLTAIDSDSITVSNFEMKINSIVSETLTDFENIIVTMLLASM